MVIIQNYAYSPTDLTIPVGTTVTWKNLDADDHTASSDTPGGFDVYCAGDGGMGTFTFDTPGYFPYHCDYHAEMHGSVTVTA